MFRMRMGRVDLNFDEFFSPNTSEITRAAILGDLKIEFSRLESRRHIFSRFVAHWFNKMDSDRHSNSIAKFEKSVEKMIKSEIPTPEFSLKENQWGVGVYQNNGQLIESVSDNTQEQTQVDANNQNNNVQSAD